MPTPPRLFVGTLHCGESELAACVAALGRQSYPHWTHEVIADLPNREAHERLYGRFMALAGAYDLFVKLDADMVFRRDDALERIVAIFAAEPELDDLESLVHDFYSDSLIKGMHVFSARVRWRTLGERLFVDASPDYPGRGRLLAGPPAPFVDHSPNPSAAEALSFGLHRALKAVQPGRTIFRVERSLTQWRILRRTWRHFVRSGDRRLGLAVWAADAVIEGRLAALEIERKSELPALLVEETRKLGVRELRDELAARWDSDVRLALRARSRALGRWLAALRHRASRIARSGPPSV